MPLSLFQFRAHVLPTDPPLGMTYRVFDPKGSLVVVGQAQVRPNTAGQVSVPLAFTPKGKTTYSVTFDVNDVHGNRSARTARLIVR
jgi:hypothetical protein